MSIEAVAQILSSYQVASWVDPPTPNIQTIATQYRITQLQV